jgi:hypothetical protein
MARRPPEAEWVKFLRARGHGLGMLTGTDWAALKAIAACWELSCCADDETLVLEAARHLLKTMQQKCWPMAMELIAWARDWSDIERIWPRVVPASEALTAIFDARAVQP